MQRAGLSSGALAAVAVLGLVSGPGASLGTATGGDLSQAAARWLASLDEDQRDEILYAFDDDERFDIRLAPIWLEGLRRDDMTPLQWQGLMEVLGTTLSPAGLEQVRTVISLEREVVKRDQESFAGRMFGGLAHGEERYYAALFGEPGGDAPWGLRVDGHHLSLNWTALPDGRVVTVPEFLGAEPREVRQGWQRAGLRALGAEEDAARDLWNALDEGQRASAELPFEEASGPGFGNRPLFLGEGERIELAAPEGVARKDMNPAQQVLLDRVVNVYLSRYREDIQRARNAAIDAAGRDALHFAWSGSFTPGEPLYYRVQGPSLLVEFDDTVPAADHVHTVVRDVTGDFARDVLADHHARYHAPGRATHGALARHD